MLGHCVEVVVLCTYVRLCLWRAFLPIHRSIQPVKQVLWHATCAHTFRVLSTVDLVEISKESYIISSNKHNVALQACSSRRQRLLACRAEFKA